MHACGFADDLCGAAEGAPNGGREFLTGLQLGFWLHGDLSNNTGFRPELSYTLHLSAKRRYPLDRSRSMVQGFGDSSRLTVQTLKVQRQLSRSEAVPDVPIVPAVSPLGYVQHVKLRLSSLIQLVHCSTLHQL